MSKAKRYVPKNKPNLQQPKGTLLYLFTVPLILSVFMALFKTEIQAFILNGISLFLFLIVLHLAKKGFYNETHYHATHFTHAPKVPYKMLAGILLGAATFFTAYFSGEQAFLKSAFLAIIASIGYFMYYGFDPKEDKLENLGDISAKFVLTTIHEAKSKLSSIKKHMEHIKDAVLHNKLNAAILKSEQILQTIQEDPKDIRVARKFLIVYIDGIAKVTNAYTALNEEDINVQTKKKLHTLMDDVQIRFDKELSRLQNNNTFDLDVHIDVLKEQIKH